MLSEQAISETTKIEELIMDNDNLKKQDYGSILRALCNRMSLKGINNFIHYDYKGELLVEIKNTTEFYNKGFYSPIVDFVSQRLYLSYREDLKDL